MNWIKRYFKKQSILSQMRYCHNEIKAANILIKDFGLCHEINDFIKNEITENNDKLLSLMKQLKELEK